MRKILSLVLCLLMLVAVFAGCTKTAEEPAKTEETKTTEPAESKEPEGGKTEGTPVGNGTLTLTEDPVEITVWMPYNDVSDTEEMKLSPYPGIIEDFEEKYPNVTIIFEGLGADSGRCACRRIKPHNKRGARRQPRSL